MGTNCFHICETIRNCFRRRIARRRSDARPLPQLLIDILSDILNNDRFTQAADDNARAAEFRALLSEFSAKIDADPLMQPATINEISQALWKHSGELSTKIKNLFSPAGQFFQDDSVATAIAECAIKAVFKHFKEHLDSTGIVIAGYGEDDFFPSLVQYRFFGFLGE